MSEDQITRGKADLIDQNVGRRLRVRRILLGLSQQEVGKSVNVSIQQIQKYELGTNRIACGRLFSLAKLLKVPIGYFFESPDGNNNLEVEDDSASEKELLTLVRSYNSIDDNNIRKKILDLVKGPWTNFRKAAN